MKKLILFAFLAVAFIECEKNNDEKQINYKLSFDFPETAKNGNEYNINANIEPNASEVSGIELFLDGKSVEKKFSQPFSFKLTLKDLLTGEHKLIMSATMKDGSVINSDEKKFTFSVNLGDEYQGGVVIKLTDNGVHGTIASKSDLTGGISGKYKYGAYNGNYQAYSMDDGLENTNKFAGKYDNNYAAIACLNLELNGYNDWYLPAINEFEYIKEYENVLIQDRLQNIYWTSTLRQDNTHAEIYAFGRVSYTISDLDVQEYHYVKPCRRF